MAVKHSTSSDGTFSGTGATAWDASHTVDNNTLVAAKLSASATDILFGRSTAAAGAGEEIACTAAARSILDDATTAAILTTLGGQTAWTFDIDVSGTADAAIAAAVETFYVRDISGYTANRTLTLPAVAAVGQRVGVMLTNGDDTYHLLTTATAGDTLNGVAGGTEWSRLFISTEVLIFRCIVANTTWIVEYDGRIPMKAFLRLSTSPSANEAAATFVYATAASPTAGVWTADIDVGNVTAVATEKITFRRACKAMVVAAWLSVNSIADQKYGGNQIELNGTTLLVNNSLRNPVLVAMRTISIPYITSFAAGDYIRFKYRSEEGSKGAASNATAFIADTHMSAVELI